MLFLSKEDISSLLFTRQSVCDNISDMIERGLKIFVFYLSVLSICRVIFIFVLSDYMDPAASLQDIWLAMSAGFRLSMQTAGIMMMITMIPGVLAHMAGGIRAEKRVVMVVSGAVLTTLSILFVASFPYYRQFHAKFNQLMFNTANDDVYALLVSLVYEFWLPLRLAAACLMGFILWKLLMWFLRRHTPHIAEDLYFSFLSRCRYASRLRLMIMLIILPVLAVLVFFGGSFSWKTAIDWENAGVTRDDLLNEAILDDYQAVYRAYRLNDRLLACNGLNFTTDQIRELAAELSGKPADSDNLDSYITRSAGGSQLEQPKHIFLILSESLAAWPLLDRYEELHISDGLRSIIEADDTEYCRYFLPNGASTVAAMTAIVTGFADANLYLTTMPEAYEAPYPTAAAPQFKRLGYETNFWYAGADTWERIGAFTLAQGFDHFYGRGSMEARDNGSVWGIEDEYLYRNVLQRVSRDTSSFNVILNVSNHSPYDVDVIAKGFNPEAVRKALPEEEQDNASLINQLGHYWYADQEIAKLVNKLKEKYPGCLIVIAGDHADRYNVGKRPSMYEQYAIPFIVTGEGIHKGIFNKAAAGSQIDIVPTIIEMIAPKGFSYEAVGTSLTKGNAAGVNYGFWINHFYIGEADRNPLEPISIEGAEPEFDEAAMQHYIDAVRSISWWRAKYGPVLNPELLEDR